MKVSIIIHIFNDTFQVLLNQSTIRIYFLFFNFQGIKKKTNKQTYTLHFRGWASGSELKISTKKEEDA